MKLSVTPTPRLDGTVTIPGSKSQSIRALVLATLAKGQSRIDNLLICDDTDDALAACCSLGAKVELKGNDALITGPGLPFVGDVSQLFTGNSGITTRFILPALGLRPADAAPLTLDCGEQMRARPIASLVDALCQLGMQIKYVAQPGALPISISGQLRGGTASVDGMTSQYTSALLMSLPCALQDSTVIVRDLHERPYVEMTLQWLYTQRIQFNHEQREGEDVFHIPGNQRYAPFVTSIPGDFSSASTVIAAACLIPGTVLLKGLDMNDPQGDKRLVAILQQMGASITMMPGALKIEGGRPLQGIRIDANDIPDLLPALAVVGAFAHGETVIFNVQQARIKETDRIHSMAEGLSRLGADVTPQLDGLVIRGGQALYGAALSGYGDHRTVMALSVAGMLASGLTEISDAEAIDKTFPTFVEIMKSIGAQLEVLDDR